MVLEQRSLQLLDLLIRNESITIGEIEKRLKLTRRQIDYDLVKINNWLVESKVPQLEKLRQKGIIIPSATKRYFIEHLSAKGENHSKTAYVFSEKERKAFIFLLLFNHHDYISLNHFIYSLNISKSTVLKDIKKLDKDLKQYDVSIMYDRSRGYSIGGDEQNLRYCMMRFIIKLLSNPNGTILLDRFISNNQFVQVKDIQPIIQEASQKWSIKFVENRMQEFIYSFIFIISRIKGTNHRLTMELSKSVFKNTNEFQFSEDILSGFTINSTEETAYMCGWILGLSMGNLDKNTNDRTILVELLKGIIDRFESLAGIRFVEQNQDISQLYTHFRPAYYRLLFKLPIVNALLPRIQNEYKEMYKLVEETMKPFNAVFGGQVPNEEIAYLTIHFASIIKNSDEEFIERKTALIVCPSGVGTSAILYKELSTLFPEFKFIKPINIEELDSIHEEIDILFSTVPTAKMISKKTPLVIVNPIMSSLEKIHVIQNVYAQMGKPVYNPPSIQNILGIIEEFADIKDRFGLEKSLYHLFSTNNKIEPQEVKEPLLSEITNEKLIQLNIEVANWQEAIVKAGQPLVDEEKVSPEYIKAMIESAIESGPYIVIAKHVALPHARPEAGSKEIAISMTRLKHPVHFGNPENDPVRYIFCLSAIDNKTHLTAMAELVELLDCRNFYNKFDEASDSKEVYEFILKYEQEANL
ncbi:transcriptional antiterminator/mannitol/fructose-specific phosphotransferase system IIA component (Ntr-type) [Bacillus niacini]|uniref:Transcriptional antiterminator/mannitol/fructose-specific phosphotransferase system IIA component (Ntr-type) n=1 Tax=Neobacillus niacini TaxID=86668 RepID=A0A852TNG8_9BACI|nr:BglG family transcription antiterminator [Neobacillus niacini]NYE08987.1 transcriptional antiterminator/mannitol/fructose-specific phosphotransferase system IIA component (Ntr-type) [Neobacillus niacini]